jgi:hypothetical protein
MSSILISILLLVATLGCIVVSLIIRAWMIAGINLKRDSRSQISYLERGIRINYLTPIPQGDLLAP